MLKLSHLTRVYIVLQIGRWGWEAVMGADKSHRKWGLPGWLLASCFGAMPIAEQSHVY